MTKKEQRTVKLALAVFVICEAIALFTLVWFKLTH